MSIPNFQAVMLPLLRISVSEISISEATERLSSEFNLTEEERTTLVPSKKQTKIKNRVAWAKTYLVKAGLLKITKRAYFVITEQGQALLDNHIPDIDVNFLNQYSEFRDFRAGNKINPDQYSYQENDDNNLTPEELIHNSLEQIEEALGDEILNKIMSRDSDFFENLMIKLLVAMGYGGSIEEAGNALGRSDDGGGVNGVIDQDILGSDRIYVQAKRCSEGNNIGSGAIRDFFGSIDKMKASKGLFVTTSDFTDEAKETAQLLSKRIVLLNGKQLVKLMIRYEIGCRIEEKLYIKKIDEDFFE